MEREMDRQIGAASAVMRALYRTVVVKRELSRKAKLSIYQSIYVPTLTPAKCIYIHIHVACIVYICTLMYNVYVVLILWE